MRGSLYPSSSTEKDPLIGSVPIPSRMFDGIGIKVDCGPDWAEDGYAKRPRIRMKQKVRISFFVIR